MVLVRCKAVLGSKIFDIVGIFVDTHFLVFSSILCFHPLSKEFINGKKAASLGNKDKKIEA